MEIVAEYGDLCGEGPVWDPGAQALYWTDITGRRFFRYDWATKQHKIVQSGLQISGYRINRPGGFVIANAEGVWLWDVDGNRYLDCISAYSAVNQGHCHPRIRQALLEQSGRVALTSRATPCPHRPSHNSRRG